MAWLMPFVSRIATHFLTAYLDKLVKDEKIRKQFLAFAEYMAAQKHASKRLRDSARKQRERLQK